MNMLLHGVEDPNIRYRESLSEEVSDKENLYTLILANPPFKGSLDFEATSQRLQRVVKTKKTELLSTECMIPELFTQDLIKKIIK